MTFYNFPNVQRVHMQTMCPIESTFATIRYPTAPANGCVSHDSSPHMMFAFGQCAEKNWRKLRGFAYLPEGL